MLNKLGTTVIFLLASLPGTLVAHGKASLTHKQGNGHPARAIVFPDVADRRTLVVDLHTHSVFSDGHVWPKIRVEEAQRDGLDAIAVTEHLEYQPHLADIPHTDRNRSYELASAAAVDTDLLVISGSEITRAPPAGHINAIFLKDANLLLQVDNPPKDPQETIAYYTAAGEWPAIHAVEEAVTQGAFVFWNHPFWRVQQPTGKATLGNFQRDLIRKDHLHGIEIANGSEFSEEAFAIALKHNLTLLGVSDVHDLIDWDYQPTDGGHRPVTLVFAQAKNQQALREALFERATVVWFKNTLAGRKAYLLPLLQASLRIGPASYIPDTQILSVSIENRSDANFQLESLSKLTFANSGNLIEVPAHSSIRLEVKGGLKKKRLELPFAVRNALVAPRKFAKLTLATEVSTLP